VIGETKVSHRTVDMLLCDDDGSSASLWSHYTTTKLLYRCIVVLHGYTMPSDATISVSTETRDELRAYKQGGITTYDEILQAMLDEVDPEEVI